MRYHVCIDSFNSHVYIIKNLLGVVGCCIKHCKACVSLSNCFSFNNFYLCFLKQFCSLFCGKNYISIVRENKNCFCISFFKCFYKVFCRRIHALSTIYNNICSMLAEHLLNSRTRGNCNNSIFFSVFCIVFFRFCKFIFIKVIVL